MFNGFTEREITLRAVKQLSTYAWSYPVGVEPHTLKDNIAYINREAKKLDCTPESCWLISIHANTSTDFEKKGSIVYYHPDSKESITLANSIAKVLNARLLLPDDRNRHGRLGIIRDVENVAPVLVELGFMSNPSDLKRLTTEDWAKTIYGL